MLYGKNVVLGVSGGIACYKACEIVSRLKKAGAGVDVVMTQNACRFVAPLTFQTLAKSAVALDPFEPVKQYDINHISLAKKADILVIAPATANVIAKLANGIADDLLSTTFLACEAKKLVCPAMNSAMLDDPATTKNLQILRERGVDIMPSPCGELACGDVGKGRMAEPEDIVKRIVSTLVPDQSMHGMRALVTAGGTEEDVDGVRVLSNRSSGKMGVALAEACAARGASVIFVHGNMSVPVPRCVEREIYARTTLNMLEACETEFENCDIAIMAAAPADYKVKNCGKNKLKANSVCLELEKNPDIAAALGEKKGNRKLVIFAAETENLLQNASEKLLKKHADMVVANDVTAPGAGFDSDNNAATLILADGSMRESGLVSKRRLADLILDVAL